MYIKTCKCGKVLSTKEIQSGSKLCESCVAKEFYSIKTVRNRLKENCKEEWCKVCKVVSLCNREFLHAFLPKEEQC